MPTASHPEGDTEDWEMLLAGYRACAAEAIRFLTEEESVPADSPLILGLWEHLLAQESHLDLVSSAPAEGDSGINMSDIAAPGTPHQPSSPLRPVSCHITDTDNFPPSAPSYPSPQCQKAIADQMPTETNCADTRNPGDETVSHNNDSHRTEQQGTVPLASQYGSSSSLDSPGCVPVVPRHPQHASL